ncbi:hypothetical protein LPY66_08095 [Dehalobacter sp. DCM]|uniref:DUF7479 domain-containing protein n=1 Tax=Dehalobacter sp. DCM TaxID=2907827 RepID=UPI003081391A|nr:hypothetical protein LPY66_08095 [Dehalobacter sp. DCM]
MKKYICNKCGATLEILDLDTKYLEFDGMQEGYACDTCNEWWFSSKISKVIVKGEGDCEAKME